MGAIAAASRGRRSPQDTTLPRRSPMSSLFLSLVVIASASATDHAEIDDALCPTTAVGLGQSIETTFIAWDQTDQKAYLAARDRVFIQLDCITELLNPAIAADVHAIMAMDAFMARRPEDMAAALRAYAAARPEVPLAERIGLPPALAAAAAEAAASVSTPEAPLPDSVSFWVDGAPATMWSQTRPAILQATAADESERIWTDRVPLGGPLPTPPVWTSKAALVAASRSKRRAVIWWTSSGVSAVTSGGLWWAALKARSEFNGYADTVAASGPLPNTQRTAVTETAQRANRLGVAAQIFSGATLGLGAVALTVSF